MNINIDTDKMNIVGQNIVASKVGDNLVIVVDTSKTIGLSSTGKMMGIASTNGFAFLTGDIRGNIYIGKKP